MGKVQVLSGDCIRVMQALQDNSIDAVCTDPPYGLEFMGKEWDSFEVKTRKVKGTGGNNAPFANHAVTLDAARGKEFQAWCEQWASECLRVLKPGGHLLAFGGTRTYHRMACAIEDAGFEIRDSLHWIYGSGFPKSMDVSKAIDKAARGVPQGSADPTSPNHGKYRTQKTEGKRWDGDTGQGFGAGGSRFLVDGVESGAGTEHAESGDAKIVPDAKQWEGWGTALKPAHEPIVMARKPLASKTVAANVLAYGTGGLNIDGTRVPTADRWEATGTRSAAGSSLAGSVDGSLNVSVSSTHDGGRWPTNILLTHAPGCRSLGEKQVKNMSGSVAKDVSSSPTADVYGTRERVIWQAHGVDGMETVEAWDCAAGCPVAELDRQSGIKATTRHMSYKRSGGEFIDGIPSQPVRDWFTSETGGASRFFPCFRYQAKAPSSQRPKEDGIIHPTVKPLELMRWLVRLVTPPDGVVLDPFAGSGTTGEACLEEGFRCVLVEREPGYLRLIRKRLDSRVPTLWD